jgi:hypothetical protein
MFIKSKWAALIYRLILVGLCACGIILTVSSSTVGGLWDMLSYYTIQSNIIVLLFFVGLIIYSLCHRNQPLPPKYYTIKGAVMTCITLTLLIYHFVLLPTLFAMSTGAEYATSPSNALVHYVTPLLAIADWLLFDRKGSFRKLDPLFWTIIPWAYLGFSLIRAQFATFSYSGSHYPYFFIDIDLYGIPQVILNVLIIAVGYVALGYIILLIDRGLAKLKLTRPNPKPSS